MKFKGKTMLHCFRGMKRRQCPLKGFDIKHLMFLVKKANHTDSVMDSKSELSSSDPGFFPGREEYEFAFQ